MVEMFANSGDPDQMPHSAASDLGLHCLLITLSGVSRLQWVKNTSTLVGHFVSSSKERDRNRSYKEREKERRLGK